MNSPIVDNCRCTGTWCTCTGKKVLRDGHGVISVPLMLTDALPAASPTLSLDALVKDAKYDPYRGHFNDNGVPLDRHIAMIDLEQQSDAAQRAEAYHDHMVDELANRTFADVGDARAKMIADMSSAYQR